MYVHMYIRMYVRTYAHTRRHIRMYIDIRILRMDADKVLCFHYDRGSKAGICDSRVSTVIPHDVQGVPRVLQPLECRDGSL